MNSSSFSSPNFVNSEPIEQNLQINMVKYDCDREIKINDILNSSIVFHPFVKISLNLV